MRLGAYTCQLKPGSRAAAIYGATEVLERHRHRYEFNKEYEGCLTQGGLVHQRQDARRQVRGDRGAARATRGTWRCSSTPSSSPSRWCRTRSSPTSSARASTTAARAPPAARAPSRWRSRWAGGPPRADAPRGRRAAVPHRRAVRHREPDAIPAAWPRGSRTSPPSSASRSSSRPATTRPTAPAWGRTAGRGSTAGSRSWPASATATACPSSPTCTRRRTWRRRPRSPTCCRSRPSSAGRPTSCWRPRARARW